MAAGRPEKPKLRWLPVAIGVAVVVAVGLGLVWVARTLMQDKPQGPQRQVAQVVQLVRPPPPPPETPPPPPPEEKIEEPLPQDTPDQTPPEADSPAEQLGLDADGVAGGDGFGLAARKGGREIGLGGAAFGWYTTRLKDTILGLLSDDERIRKGKYQVTVSVWLAEDGRVGQIKLRNTTGNPELDRAIEAALAKIDRAQEPPPLEMPQPVTLRIVSR